MVESSPPHTSPAVQPVAEAHETYSVIHTEWSDGWGGQEHRIVTEMAAMQARGHRLLLATRASAKIAVKARALGIPVVELPFRNRLDLGTVLALRALVKRDGYQFIHTHSSIDTWLGGIAAKLSGARFVRTRHLNIPMQSSRFNIHGHYDHLITCGEVMRQCLIEDYGFRPEALSSIPTGVDFAGFTPSKTREQMRAELGIAADSFLVLMVGVVRGVKRYDVAIRGFAKLLAELPNARLVIAGDGPMFSDMKALCSELGIQDAVLWLGHRQDVPNLMNAADTVLLTSRSEGVPQALTQALGLGLPCVATRVGGVPEIIQHEQSGLLVPSGGFDEVAAALLRIYRNRDWALALGRRGQEFIRAHLSLARMIEKTEDLYRDLLRVR